MSDVFERHPRPWRTDEVEIFDAADTVVMTGMYGTPATLIVEAVNTFGTCDRCATAQAEVERLRNGEPLPGSFRFGQVEAEPWRATARAWTVRAVRPSGTRQTACGMRSWATASTRLRRD